MTSAEEREARLAAEPMRLATPPARFFKGVRSSLIDIWNRRQLLNRLVRREIRARYKDSILGVVWSLIRPLVSLLIYYLVLGRLLGAARSIPDFAIYVFTGLTVWQLVSESISTCTASIVGNSGIIKKIQLPREIFPLASVGASLFNFLMQFIILVLAALLIRGLAFDSRLLYLPLALVVIVIWCTALGLILSAANVYLRDIQYLVEVVLMVGMWASPIVYSWDMVVQHTGRILQEIYLANPVTLSVMGFQRSLWIDGANEPSASHLAVRLLVSLVAGLIALMLAQRVFAVMQRDFAQEL